MLVLFPRSLQLVQWLRSSSVLCRSTIYMFTFMDYQKQLYLPNACLMGMASIKTHHQQAVCQPPHPVASDHDRPQHTSHLCFFASRCLTHRREGSRPALPLYLRPACFPLSSLAFLLVVSWRLHLFHPSTLTLDWKISGAFGLHRTLRRYLMPPFLYPTLEVTLPLAPVLRFMSVVWRAGYGGRGPVLEGLDAHHLDHFRQPSPGATVSLWPTVNLIVLAGVVYVMFRRPVSFEIGAARFWGMAALVPHTIWTIFFSQDVSFAVV